MIFAENNNDIYSEKLDRVVQKTDFNSNLKHNSQNVYSIFNSFISLGDNVVISVKAFSTNSFEDLMFICIYINYYIKNLNERNKIKQKKHFYKIVY